MPGTPHIKYSPVAIGVSETPFDQMGNMEFGGKTPYEMYNEEFRGDL